MTRRQLAGLRFFADHDHYKLTTGSASAEARRWTGEIVVMAQAAIADEKLWDRFTAWSPAPAFDLGKVANTVFSDDPFNVHLDHVTLTRHWLTHLTYRRSPSARAELADGPEGLIRWDVAGLFDRIRRSVENGGVALRPARRR
jgi:hypothetical protein